MKFTVLIDLASIQGNLGIFIHKTYSCSSDFYGGLRTGTGDRDVHASSQFSLQ